jgi:hypothetical protein
MQYYAARSALAGLPGRGRGVIPHCISPQAASLRVLAEHDGKYDFAARASLAQYTGTLGCRHRHWLVPMSIKKSRGVSKPRRTDKAMPVLERGQDGKFEAKTTS